MNFNYDPNTLSYHLGETEPYAGMSRQMLFGQSHQVLAVDSETISLKEKVPIGIGIAISSTEAFYFRLFPEESPVTPWQLLKDTGITKVYHNVMFDAIALREYEVDNANILDTSVMSRLLCHRYNSLVDLSYIHQLEAHDVKEYIPSGGTMLDVDLDTVARKCMQDCLATYRLYECFWDKVDHQYMEIGRASCRERV